MYLRILTALFGIPLLLAIAYFGGFYLFAGVMIIVVLGLKELFSLLKKMNFSPATGVGYFTGLTWVVATYFNNGAYLGLTLFLNLILFLIMLLKDFPENRFADLAGTFLATLYGGWLISHLMLLRELTYGFTVVLLVFVLTWMNDTGAYFVGRSLGRRRLSVLSPKKTVEGAVGGILLTIITGIVFWLSNPALKLTHILVISLLTSVMGLVGDLIESGIKRLAQVKDAGQLIPGHGGVLDRFDSMFMTCPLVYYYFTLFKIS